MLSNAVVLFLRDALPIFWSLALLVVLIAKWPKWLVPGSIVGLILSFLVFQEIGTVSSWFDGNGYEFFQISLHILSYLIFAGIYCFVNTTQNKTSLLLMAAAVSTCIIVLNTTNAMVFFSSFWRLDGNNSSLFIGLALGVGICTSIATLLVLLLKPLTSFTVSKGLLLLFVSGQVAHIANLLQQINWITSEQLWNSSQIISDENEVGEFLATLFGYESSPTSAYLSIYLIALIAPLIVSLLLNRTTHTNLEPRL
ncbi:hypothetical protein [Aliiglaciecola sp. LCG003]|uniref:hypothetical protein n=1 Tax=Aliiglaciecola sp. LCG003 TaxID=3053655 RepID=UPI00257329D6|nr:hypothetical protein [Aliiglaciecola sp. LCG003]WJG09265.1 hypothetical protein QR722_18345 [Aliiglaciecola sp. LCG003]